MNCERRRRKKGGYNNKNFEWTTTIARTWQSWLLHPQQHKPLTNERSPMLSFTKLQLGSYKWPVLQESESLVTGLFRSCYVRKENVWALFISKICSIIPDYNQLHTILVTGVTLVTRAWHRYNYVIKHSTQWYNYIIGITILSSIAHHDRQWHTQELYGGPLVHVPAVWPVVAGAHGVLPAEQISLWLLQTVHYVAPLAGELVRVFLYARDLLSMIDKMFISVSPCNEVQSNCSVSR